MKIIYYFLLALVFMLSACSTEEPMTLVATGSVEKIYRDVNNKEKTVVDVRKEDGKIESFATSPDDISTIYDIEEGSNVYVYKTQSNGYKLSSLEMTPQRMAKYWEEKTDSNAGVIGFVVIALIVIIALGWLLKYAWETALIADERKREIETLKERLSEEDEENEE